ncbi:MAG: hypothetical protein ABIF71_02845 [Planctomycetota bacterium]
MAADAIYGTAKPGGIWPLKRISPTDSIAAGETVDHAMGGHFTKPVG